MNWFLSSSHCGGGGLLPDLYRRIPRDAQCNPEINSLGDILQIAANVIQVVLRGAGIVAVIAIIIGGILYISSLGDPQRTAKAKSTIYYAVLGLVITLAAYGIVRFVTDSFNG